MRRHRWRSREAVVDQRFRGWAWQVPPIDPPYDYELGLDELANRYCESMRDLYLKHVEKKTRPADAKMVEGGLYHSVVASVIHHAKKEMYNSGSASGFHLGPEATQIRDKIIDDMLKRAKTPETTGRGGSWDRNGVRANMVWIWDHEVNQIDAKLDQVLSVQPYIGIDALVNAVIPVSAEQKLDGRNIGFSGRLSADAFGAEGVVLDINTGARRQFHRLSTTGCAMVVESIHEYPIDMGCIVYCWFKKPIPPTIEYDVHQIDEPLRWELLDLRDAAIKMICDQRDPGLPRVCYEDCPYWDECH